MQRFALPISIRAYTSMVALEQRKSQYRIGDREQTQRWYSRPSEVGILSESCYSRQVQCVKGMSSTRGRSVKLSKHFCLCQRGEVVDVKTIRSKTWSQVRRDQLVVEVRGNRQFLKH